MPRFPIARSVRVGPLLAPHELADESFMRHADVRESPPGTESQLLNTGITCSPNTRMNFDCS